MTQPVSSAVVRRRSIGLALAFFLWSAVLLTVVKLLLAQAIGSLSLLACAIHSLLLCFSALLAIQSRGRSRNAAQRRAPSRQGFGNASGLLQTITTLLMYSLLGFGGFSLLSLLLQRGTAGWVTQTVLSWRGGELEALSSLTGEAATLDWQTAATLHPALLPLLGTLAVVGFALALLARFCARYLSSRTLAFHSYLLLQDSWLVLIAGVALMAMGQGVMALESLAALGILAMVMADAWRWLGVHMPHWRQEMAIAPEAIVATAQQVDGIIGCRVLHCRGMVGRHLAIALELRLHPEFESLRHRLGRKICFALERRYGPTQIEIYLVTQPGGPRRYLNVSQDEDVSWVDGLDDASTS